ncbi:MAG: ATP-binding protein [Ginsengibacter sp.]
MSDTGIGVSPIFTPHLFERFSQQDSSSTRTHGRLGLGLSICKSLVEMHGGQIAVTCAGEGNPPAATIRICAQILQRAAKAH